jgi:hypothetical protein
MSFRWNSPNPPQKPENRDLGDGTIRFIMPQDVNAPPAVIRTYNEGHPAVSLRGRNCPRPGRR